jgi:hypothetical protein
MVLSLNFIWGTGLDGIEVRNNSIVARPGNPIGNFPEGYWNLAQYQDGKAPYSPNSAAPAVLGTIFQGNNCTNCQVFYHLNTGSVDTIIWNSYINNVAIAALAQPLVIKDERMWNTATHASTGTVVGHD